MKTRIKLLVAIVILLGVISCAKDEGYYAENNPTPAGYFSNEQPSPYRYQQATMTSQTEGVSSLPEAKPTLNNYSAEPAQPVSTAPSWSTDADKMPPPPSHFTANQML